MARKNRFVGIALILTLILFSLAIIALPTFFIKDGGRVTIDRTISLPLIDQQDTPLLLLFFGYTGCVDICTPRLQQLGSMISELPADIQQRSKLLFFDVSKPEVAQVSDDFAKSFSDRFEGVPINDGRLDQYTRAFDIYYAPSLSDPYEYDHTPHLYMLKKEKNRYHLRHIYYAYPYNEKQLVSDIKALLNE
jgi:protein SCO1/2